MDPIKSFDRLKASRTALDVTFLGMGIRNVDDRVQALSTPPDVVSNMLLVRDTNAGARLLRDSDGIDPRARNEAPGV